MTKFEAGRTYYTRSVADADCKVIVNVISRTDKSIVTSEGKRFKIFQYDGSECVRPWGNYSMAPIVKAERELTQ